MAERGVPGPLLRVEDLSVVLGRPGSRLGRLLGIGGSDPVRAVEGVSFEIGRGRAFGLVGGSGAGKSTLARCVVGLAAPSAGRVLLDGVDLARVRSRRATLAVRRRVQMVFQDPFASLDPRWRVRAIVAEPIRTHRLAEGRAVDRRVDELLGLVGLRPEDGGAFPHAFSGGQRQRIAIARALASEPDLLVCDEPTSALDVSVQAQVLNLLKDLQQGLGLACLVISHDLAVVSFMADEIGVMQGGRLVERAEAAALLRAPRHPETRRLLDAAWDLQGPEGR